MKADRKVSVLVMVLLEAAQGAGMTKERAEAIYEDIIAHYQNMREGFSEALVEQVAKVLAFEMPDDV